MVINMIGGRPKVATITVTTTAGATVTCVLSPYSFSATANSSGKASFVVPKVGTWAITSKSGSNTKSGSVAVSAVGGSYTITLTLIKYLYHSGTQDVAWTAGQYATLGSSYMSLNTYTYVTTTGTVDLTSFSNIVVKHRSLRGNSIAMTGGCTSSKVTTYVPTYDASAALTSGAEKTSKISISSITGSKYVCFTTKNFSPADEEHVITEVYLE